MKGNMVKLPLSNGQSEYTWSVSFTEDGEVWRTILFEGIEDARGLARDLIRVNSGNERFSIGFKRTVVCDTYEFLDECLEPSQIHVVAPSVVAR